MFYIDKLYSKFNKLDKIKKKLQPLPVGSSGFLLLPLLTTALSVGVAEDAAGVDISVYSPNFGTLTLTGFNYNTSSFDNDGTLEINSGGTLYNSDTLNNNNGATLDNDGTLDNFGTLNNKFGATLDNSGTLYNNFGTLDNDGTFRFFAPTRLGPLTDLGNKNSGNWSLGLNTEVLIDESEPWLDNEIIRLVENTGSITGNIFSIEILDLNGDPFDASIGSWIASWEGSAETSNLQLTFTSSTLVPEPGAYALLGSLLTLSLASRKRPLKELASFKRAHVREK